jgi:hypothetical protein
MPHSKLPACKRVYLEYFVHDGSPLLPLMRQNFLRSKESFAGEQERERAVESAFFNSLRSEFAFLEGQAFG